MEEKKNIESEMNFKSFLKNPLRLFSLVYVYFFIIALSIGIYYVNNLDAISFNTIPGTSLDTLNVEREIETKIGGIKPAMDLKLISEPTPELISKGKDLYKSTCASCHGDDGKGDGVASVALNPKPRDFHSLDGWTNGRTFYDFYKSVNDGVAGTGMTAYEFISPEDRVAIIQYIRTMAEYPEVTLAEVNDKLDATYNLSAGVIDPNNIPISKSVSLYDSESLDKEELVKQISGKIQTDESSEAELLKSNTEDLSKAVASFINSDMKQSYQSFMNSISTDPYSIGMKSSILHLNSTDLMSIYNYLKIVCS